MKNVLPILLCYVLMTSQVYAISGGPVYGGSGINPVGVYSGVITVDQVLDFVLDPDTGATVTDPNTGLAETTVDESTVSLGLFSLGVPSVSVATGAFIQFVNGDVFIGSIVASVESDSGVLAGIVEGTSSYSVTSGSAATGTSTTTTIVVENRAAGKINAQVSGTRQGSLASGLLIGKSNIVVNTGGARVTGGSTVGSLVENYSLNCTVTGFRQSQSYSAVTTLGLNTSGTD